MQTPETGEITFNIEWLRGKVADVVPKLQAEQAAIWQLLATSPQTTRRDTLQEDVVLRPLALPL